MLYTKLRVYECPLIRRSAYTNLRSTTLSHTVTWKIKMFYLELKYLLIKVNIPIIKMFYLVFKYREITIHIYNNKVFFLVLNVFV